ncbi:hypothetical protein [Acinetobacter baumannii]|uniref:hypothetical protein n=1 Tax=Acinetobacter baumannii TaxID=470 RepID=UPI0010C80506|nr:hypothetical protein [Acinetobacter baumannii]NDW80030.1 hypothetical protein [Acinetobacter baumannii]NDW97847.1 hypothetical protein [Acinetobacter baumannii]QCP22419.1 hypothetical protein FDF35_01260 [Acinetobacter baumannii]
MKPEQFIREFGVEKAREVVEGAPEGSSHLQAIGSEKLIHYFGVKDEDVQLFFINHWRPTCFDPSDLDDDLFISLEHFKRLVESVDLVNSLGGLKAARSEAYKDCFAYNQSLLAAIATYESIYGGNYE